MKNADLKGLAQRDALVHSPAHYNTGSIECIDAIEASLTPEEFRGFCKGNAQKYIWRAGTKAYPNNTLAEAAIVDVDKAIFYLKRIVGGS